MKSKTIPWTKIKAEYLQGVTPKDLATKYGTTSKVIRDKADHDNWFQEKTAIYDNVRQSTEEQIKDLTKLALGELKCVLSDSEADYRDKIAAARAVLDVSGLKSSKQEIEASGFSVVINNKARDVKRD